jgi:hypothetical protein
MPAQRIIDSASLTSMRQFSMDTYWELGQRSEGISFAQAFALYGQFKYLRLVWLQRWGYVAALEIFKY